MREHIDHLRQSRYAVILWVVLVSFCCTQPRKVDPLRPKATDVANFLAFLYKEKGLSHTTLVNFRSAVANTIKSARGCDVTFIFEGPVIKQV